MNQRCVRHDDLLHPISRYVDAFHEIRPDPDTLVVRYTPGDGGPPIEFGQVSSPDFCDEGLFYIENNIIKLCPETCALVEADIGAVIDILIGCGSIIR